MQDFRKTGGCSVNRIVPQGSHGMRDRSVLHKGKRYTGRLENLLLSNKEA